MDPRKSYPSDISREQFERIRPLLESVRKRTKPRTVDLHEVFNAVLYLLKSGCQWRMLPDGFPNWITVYAYFAKMEHAGPGRRERAGAGLKKSVREARTKLGRNATTSFVIVDAQSVKNTDTAEEKCYDAGKKVSGIQHRIAVDTQGLPHAIPVTTADGRDRDGALEPIDRCKPNLERVESLLVDGGYTGQSFADSVMKRIKATIQVVKRNQLRTFVLLPKRWIVERPFAWMQKCRRLWKNCKRKLNSSLQMLHLAFLRLLLRRS